MKELKNLLEFVWELALHTPWWAYIILVYAIIIGIKASQSRVISIYRMALIPVLLIFMSVYDLFTKVSPNIFTISTWSLAIFIGAVVGWWQIQGLKIKVDKTHHLIRVPGSWFTFVIILIIFAAKYSFGYQLAIDPNRNQDTQFEFGLLAISGFCAGLFVGRLICYFYRLYTGPQINLKA